MKWDRGDSLYAPTALLHIKLGGKSVFNTNVTAELTVPAQFTHPQSLGTSVVLSMLRGTRNPATVKKPSERQTTYIDGVGGGDTKQSHQGRHLWGGGAMGERPEERHSKHL